jgi:hypothetical protein
MEQSTRVDGINPFGTRKGGLNQISGASCLHTRCHVLYYREAYANVSTVCWEASGGEASKERGGPIGLIGMI